MESHDLDLLLRLRLPENRSAEDQARLDAAAAEVGPGAVRLARVGVED